MLLFAGTTFSSTFLLFLVRVKVACLGRVSSPSISTNRFLWLLSVVDPIARAKGLAAVLLHDDAEGTKLRRTDWMRVARRPQVLDAPEIREAVTELVRIPGLRPWTDDFNNLFQVLR